jgi:hypothetical protein
MKEDPLTQSQSDRKGIADEVDIMTTGSQLLPEFGRDNAAASIGRITRDANLHIRS